MQRSVAIFNGVWRTFTALERRTVARELFWQLPVGENILYGFYIKEQLHDSFSKGMRNIFRPIGKYETFQNAQNRFNRVLFW